jgi:hypothetical protein
LKLNALHRMILEKLLVEFQISELSEEQKKNWDRRET